MNEQSDAPRASLRQRILGSALSALVGWLALNLLMLFFAVAQASERSTNDWWLGAAYVAVVSAVFVLATWLGALVPLYLLVPLHSWLWRWYVCTACGAIAGATIMYAYSRYSSPQAEWGPFALLAALTGGATCLFGSLTSHRFQYAQVA